MTQDSTFFYRHVPTDKNERIVRNMGLIIWRDLCLMQYLRLTVCGELSCHSWSEGVGRVVRWSWVNFQCRAVLLIWIIVGQGPIALAVGAGGGCLDIFSLVYHFSFLSPSLCEAARYRLKYCLKGPLSPKTTNQPTILVRTVLGRVVLVQDVRNS